LRRATNDTGRDTQPISRIGGGKGMIDWKKYDPENPPEHGKIYLVTDGKNVDVAGFHKFYKDDVPEWYLLNVSAIDGVNDITHYAEINLP
jgi:hypothetical protein